MSTVFKQWFTALNWVCNVFFLDNLISLSFAIPSLVHLKITLDSNSVSIFPSTLLLCCVPGSLSPATPFTMENNGILTAFQLPQGLRGPDDCRMLMFEAPALNISGAGSAETEELWRARRLYHSDAHGWKMIPWRILIRMSQICLRHSCTSPNPRLSTQGLYKCAARLKTAGWHVFKSKRGKNTRDRLCSLIVNIVLVFLPTRACTTPKLRPLPALGDIDL